jgi:hypothetical protein
MIFSCIGLRHYVSDPTHVIDMSSLHVSNEGALTAEPFRILDQRIRQLRRRTVDQVKVQWDSYSPHSVTWEDAYDRRQQFHFCLIDRLMILWSLRYCGTFISALY